MPAFPTLSKNPEYPLSEDREDSTVRSDFEGGYEITRPRWTRTRKLFSVRYKTLPDADKTLLDTFMDTVSGGADAFTWTHPKTSVTYTVRFAKPIKFEYISFELWEVSFDLREV